MSQVTHQESFSATGPGQGGRGSGVGFDTDPVGALRLSGRNGRNERARVLAGLPLGSGVVVSAHSAHTTVSNPSE